MEFGFELCWKDNSPKFHKKQVEWKEELTPPISKKPKDTKKKKKKNSLHSPQTPRMHIFRYFRSHVSIVPLSPLLSVFFVQKIKNPLN